MLAAGNTCCVLKKKRVNRVQTRYTGKQILGKHITSRRVAGTVRVQQRTTRLHVIMSVASEEYEPILQFWFHGDVRENFKRKWFPTSGEDDTTQVRKYPKQWSPNPNTVYSLPG
eukprot:174862-Pyramimonas_sp.AAC.1